MRHKSLSIVFSLLLVLVCAGASHAIFPGFPPGARVGDGTTQVQLLHGWWSPGPVPPVASPTPAWYSCFATNNLRVAQTQGLTLSPKLSNYFTLPVMYVVTNFDNNGPVFTFSPHPLGGPNYAGLWAVIYVRWLPAATPHVITNKYPENPMNPTGVPPTTDAVYSITINGPSVGGPIFNTVGPVAGITVVDCPIFAVGNISSPWFKPTSSVPPYIYRIPQGTFFNAYSKLLTIPFWWVHCRDDVTRAIHVERMIIPDTSDTFIRSVTKANLAPLLGLMPYTAPQPSPAGGSSTMYVINWNQIVPPVLKVLTNQYPVLDACPTSCDWRNANRNYSPVDGFVLLDRTVPFISPEILFNNWEFVVEQITAGRLMSVPPFVYPPLTPGPRVNAPVLCGNNLH